jgi:hypothetical protein
LAYAHLVFGVSARPNLSLLAWILVLFTAWRARGEGLYLLNVVWCACVCVCACLTYEYRPKRARFIQARHFGHSFQVQECVCCIPIPISRDPPSSVLWPKLPGLWPLRRLYPCPYYQLIN